MAKPNITKEQLVNLISQLCYSLEGWNDCVEEPGERGRNNDPLIMILHEDGSGIFASSIYPSESFFAPYKDFMNVQHEFSNVEECAAYLIEYYDALEVTE